MCRCTSLGSRKLMRSREAYGGDPSRPAPGKVVLSGLGRATQRRPPGGHLVGTQVGRRAAWTKAVAAVTLGTEEGTDGDYRVGICSPGSVLCWAASWAGSRP